MQYVGKVGGYVYNQWNSLNPATLSGAIDIIVVEQPDGSLHCSPWHIRFGKFQIIKPSQKKIDLYVNNIKTDLPMKLGDGGEAFFVFETSSTSGADDLSKSVLTSPVISATSSPLSSPPHSASASTSFLASNSTAQSSLDLPTEPDLLDLNNDDPTTPDIENRIKLSSQQPNSPPIPSSSSTSSTHTSATSAPLNRPHSASSLSKSPTPSINNSKLAFEKARKITQKLNIPSKIDINGDMVLDMDGYKPNSQKNIDNTDELFKKIFMKEINDLTEENHHPNTNGGDDDDNNEYEAKYNLWDQIICKDKDGNIRILNNSSNSPEFTGLQEDLSNQEGLSEVNDDTNTEPPQPPAQTQQPNTDDKTYFKTLRLTSEQLQKMHLHYGQNQLKFKLNQGTSQIISNLYLWKSTTPIVISDIDGTITKSDALGHVLNLLGRDWTHPGVANLFQDISANGYNIIYLTARSVGQADTTRQYLESINQDGMKLPKGPVILSPDRTMAALKREVILKKPEVFKMACLSDIKSLYFRNTFRNRLRSDWQSTHARSGDEAASGDSKGSDDDDDTESGPITSDYMEHQLQHQLMEQDRINSNDNEENEDDDRTPFYAGFGNRITDAISYRSVKIPSHRIFTINPNGEVHMELLELAGYKSSYLHIGELVDHFFPPLKQVSDFNNIYNNNQFHDYINHRQDELQLNAGTNDARSIVNAYGGNTNDGTRNINNSTASFDNGTNGYYTYPGSPRSPQSPGSPRSFYNDDAVRGIHPDERYSDVNYWREPLSNLSDLSDLEDDEDEPSNLKSTPSSPSRRAGASSAPSAPASNPNNDTISRTGTMSKAAAALVPTTTSQSSPPSSPSVAAAALRTLAGSNNSTQINNMNQEFGGKLSAMANHAANKSIKKQGKAQKREFKKGEQSANSNVHEIDDDTSTPASVPVERPNSMSSFTSPLKNFMMFGGKQQQTANQEEEDDDDNDDDEDEDYDDRDHDHSDYTDDDDDDYTDNDEEEEDDYIDDDEDDYTDDDYDEDEGDAPDGAEQEGEADVDDEDIDLDDALPHPNVERDTKSKSKRSGSVGSSVLTPSAASATTGSHNVDVHAHSNEPGDYHESQEVGHAASNGHPAPDAQDTHESQVPMIVKASELLNNLTLSDGEHK